MLAGDATSRGIRTGADYRESLGILDSVEPARLLDLCHRNDEIAIARERGGDQRLEPWVTQEIPPADRARTRTRS